MRLAKRSQCPKCNQLYLMKLIAVVGGRDIYACDSCKWMDERDREWRDRNSRQPV